MRDAEANEREQKRDTERQLEAQREALSLARLPISFSRPADF